MHKIDKQLIAASFGHAAQTYDSAAHFQCWVGNQLLNKSSSKAPDYLVDLGCGTGFFADALQNLYPGSTYIGLDLSEKMLAYARSQHTSIRYILAGDAEALPFKAASVDMIFSSLAIQWCADLPLLMSEINRVLKPGGVFVFSSLLDGTLAELKFAWQQVDDKQHVNDFFQIEDYREAIQPTGLQINLLEIEDKTLFYNKLTEMMRELKQLGAHNLNEARNTGLMGKEKLQTVIAAYETMRNQEGKLPLSYKLLWGVLQKGKKS